MNKQYLFLFLFLFYISFSQSLAPLEGIGESICGLVLMVKNVFGGVVLFLIVLSAVIYGGGQILGAETRARANVWATTMFIGALIGVLLWIVLPWLINTILQDQKLLDIHGEEVDNIWDVCG